MRGTLLTCSLLLLSNPLFAQFGPQQIISSTTERAYVSKAVDIDNDGYIDVLKSSLETYELAWHRNLNNEGNFGEEILITDTPALYNYIGFVDVDTDGDKDLLLLINNPEKVVWIENLDGMGNFGPEQTIIENTPDYLLGITPGDIDNDGKIDIIVRFTNIAWEKLVYYKNLGGGTFDQGQTIVEDVTFSTLLSPVLADVDNDGLLDMISSIEISSGPAKIVWFKNLGNGLFDDYQEIYQFAFLLSDWTSVYGLQYVDINSDSKNDIVIIAHNDDFGTWYFWIENMDNSGNFGETRGLPQSGLFFDVDNDGDNDMVTGNRFVDRIYWIENMDGLGTFEIERDITTEIDFLMNLDVADFNGDGYLDIVSASLGDNKIAWYENTGELGIEGFHKNTLTLVPNPTFGITTLISEVPYTSLELFDATGKIISLPANNISTIDLSNLDAGIYFLRVLYVSNHSEVKKIIKI
ncbi:MAG: T9SS type A sorting domain-containing protein [Flavobacteriaceae bacterium]